MTSESGAAALAKATFPDTNTMKTGYETTKPLTGDPKLKHLWCPQCRRNKLVRLSGTITVLRDKKTVKVPADFAVCGYCHIAASIEEVPFSHVLILTEAFFPEDKCIEIHIPNENTTPAPDTDGYNAGKRADLLPATS